MDKAMRARTCHRLGNRASLTDNGTPLRFREVVNLRSISVRCIGTAPSIPPRIYAVCRVAYISVAMQFCVVEKPHRVAAGGDIPMACRIVQNLGRARPVA